MVDYTDKEYFLKNSIDKQLIIECEDGTVITNEILHSENFSLDEKLCNKKELTFGECNASIVKFRVSNIVHPLIGQWMTIKMILNHNENSAFEIGRYKVASDKPTADRSWRDIVAYDAMYDIINSDMADWYNTILPNADSTVTLKTFRSSFIQHFGLEQEEIELVNDSMVITKTIEPSEISGKDIISAICEINGCFGHIGRDNKFHYICLKQDISGLYPSDTLYPADNLYPKDPGSERIGKSYYMSCEYEDFVTKPITKLQIRKEENDIGCIYGEGDNTYIIQDNFLVYGMSAEELENVCMNLLPQISMVIYRPFKTEAKGNPCLEVGDAIRMSTRLELVETYILQRRLKGIQALRDVYESKGTEEYSEKVNSVHKSIIQLKGKTNKLERNVEETKSTITNVEKGLESQIKQTAESITLEVSKKYSTKEETKEAAGEAESNAKTDTAEKLKSYSTTTEMSSAIKQSAESISLTVEKQIEEAKTGIEQDYNAKFDLTSQQITSEIDERMRGYDTTGYEVDYNEPFDPDIPVESGKYWLNTANGNLYVGVVRPCSWMRVDSFEAVAASNDYVTWVSCNNDGKILDSYKTLGGYSLERCGYINGDISRAVPIGFNIKNNSYPLGTWLFNVCSDRLASLDNYETMLKNYIGEAGKTPHYGVDGDTMMLLEKTSNYYEEWELVKTCEIITVSNLSSAIIQNASAIVLKVNSNGEIVQVKLSADADKGTTFYIKANNIKMTATEVINLMSGGELNLTGKNITIKSNNFKVDAQGNVQCNNITAFKISGDAVSQFSQTVDDSAAMQAAQNAINTAQSAANTAQETADGLKTTVNNLNNVIVPQLNDWIRQLSSQLQELGKPGIS